MPGLDALFAELNKVVKLAVDKAIEDTALQTQIDARNLVPYDTGQLHDSIQVQREENGFNISANTDYAYYVHEGYVDKSGKFRPGTPYLSQPLNDNAALYGKRVQENMPKKVIIRVKV
ncbi:HK97 gp10 family phage protein [Deinococcus sp. Leaf326]|uniref:HK97 gp10 family phage protein n=1 Tax=Deinococcus sp. Leaf326 TaxID=1736338 RepID=UPI000B023DEB|nr:HK97 gp10 family phage protein [Deinococcus sp. Leaf326]